MDIANSRFVIPRAGFYTVLCGMNLASITTDERVRANLQVNNNVVVQNLVRSGPTDTPTTLTKTLFLEAGDLVTASTDSDTDADYLVRGGSIFNYLTISEQPDFSLYGVVKNDEHLISENIVNNVFAAQPVNTWFDLDPGWFLDVPAGEWSLAAQSFLEVSSVNTNTTGYCVAVLSTSATAAGVNLSNIVATSKGVSFSNGQDVNNRGARWQNYFMQSQQFITSGERLKMYAFTGNLSGATNVSLSLRNFIGSSVAKGYIEARRVK